jgi:hypothetical protein
LKFSIKSIEDIENGTERLLNLWYLLIC